MAKSHHASCEEGLGRLRLPDSSRGNLWMKRRFREGIVSWGAAAPKDNGETESFAFCRKGFPTFISLCPAAGWSVPTHIVLFLTNRVVFRKNVCSAAVRRLGLWSPLRGTVALQGRGRNRSSSLGAAAPALLSSSELLKTGSCLPTPSHAVRAGLLSLFPWGLFTCRW